jgi:hypothetical protein
MSIVSVFGAVEVRDKDVCERSFAGFGYGEPAPGEQQSREKVTLS